MNRIFVEASMRIVRLLALAGVMGSGAASPAMAYWVGGYYAPPAYYAPYYRPRVVYLAPPAYAAPAPVYPAPVYSAPPYVAPGYAAPRPVRPRGVVARPVRRARPIVPVAIVQPGRSPFEAAGVGPVSLSPPLPALPPAPAPAQTAAPAAPPAAPEKNVYPPERDYPAFNGD